LVRLVETVLAQVDQVESRLRRHKGKRALALADLLLQYVPLVRQVITQTTRRVFENQKVPALDKIVSLFEPHTAIIQRGKAAPHETEFGRVRRTTAARITQNASPVEDTPVRSSGLPKREICTGQ
jgi:IS5 family transposase